MHTTVVADWELIHMLLGMRFMEAIAFVAVVVNGEIIPSLLHVATEAGRNAVKNNQ